MKAIYFIFIAGSLMNAQVGINTSAPSRTLDLNGNLRVRTQTDQSANTGYSNVLIADDNGNVDYVKKNVLNQQMVQLFNLNTLPSVSAGGSGTVTPVSISNQSITLTNPAFVMISYSVPITLSAAATDGRMKLLRTHLNVDGTNVVRSSNTYTNSTTTGTNLTGIFYNAGSYITLLSAGTHTIEILGTCFDFATASQCLQGGSLSGTSFQAFAMYNSY
ncbi:hypothetical protein B0A69_21690 [Chryseobacterium shigense]|uniref:Uncharacterized protein n=1 Tax=Chryseobacterium shigense TaxID=297244 RepID=A0A1N7JKI8_9FLAO|nr:hypothetical protein [Chryseobacterium shigense]PQA89899.1 hypothetical protein B0A69_21690 [Chryseobacterium shigense]SIS49839.1 hypothetical protein SAMN05421639_10714 [Chryseobacterium shigense]